MNTTGAGYTEVCQSFGLILRESQNTSNVSISENLTSDLKYNPLPLVIKGKFKKKPETY